jgi:hypothetical protein
MSDNEGAKFWLSVLTELKNRGVKDVFVACVDTLPKGGHKWFDRLSRSDCHSVSKNSGSTLYRTHDA